MTPLRLTLRRRLPTRERITAIVAAAASETRPPAAMPIRAPYVSVTQPTTGAPIGVPPVNTIMNRAITRPRISGSVAIWTLALAVTLTVSPNIPIGTSSAANSQNPGAKAVTTSSTENSSAAATSSRSRELPRRAASSAPAREPAAISVLKSPYVPASPWNTSLTNADRKIGKLNPKVPMKPTSTIGQISSGRPAT